MINDLYILFDFYDNCGLNFVINTIKVDDIKTYLYNRH